MKEHILPESLEPSAELGLAALRRLQNRLAARGLYAGLAVCFSTLVFACVPGAHDWVKLLRSGGAPLACSLLVAAAWCWWRYIKATRELRPTGIGPSRSLRVRSGWALGGLLLSEGLAALVDAWLAPPQLVVALIRPLGLAALWIGESTRAIVPAGELRPRVATTLFDHDEGEE